MKRLSINEVRVEFENRGYMLLSNEYKNAHAELKYICLKHHNNELTISYNSLKNGKGCPDCGRESQINKRKLDFESVKNEFEKRGYLLLEKDYKNSKTKMKYQCPHHPDKELFISLNHLKRDEGCPYCSKKYKPTIDEIKLEFENRGYVLLSNTYKNNKQKLRYRCKKHDFEDLFITLSDFRNGTGCKYCGNESMVEKRKLDYDVVRSAFEYRGYVLLEENYMNENQKLKFICPTHPEKDQYITYSRLVHDNQGCTFCSKENSSGENHYNWNGGVTEINAYLRKCLSEWKLDSLKEFNFECFVTGTKKDLHVHHATSSFVEIRNKIFNETGIKILQTIGEYTEKELSILKEKIIEYHKNIIGVPLNKEVHFLFHQIYKNNYSFNDLLEFKENYSKVIETTTEQK